jgi:hypothetical protein
MNKLATIGFGNKQTAACMLYMNECYKLTGEMIVLAVLLIVII